MNFHFATDLYFYWVGSNIRNYKAARIAVTTDRVLHRGRSLSLHELGALRTEGGVEESYLERSDCVRQDQGLFAKKWGKKRGPRNCCPWEIMQTRSLKP